MLHQGLKTSDFQKAAELVHIDKKQADKVRFIQHHSCQLLYDPELLTEPDACLLKGAILTQATQVKRVANGGRGQAWFMQLGHVSAVYRQYQRGGLIAKINQQSYFGWEIEKTRSVREWRLLKTMHEQGLPVPQPIAASVCRWPSVFSPLYRAQILVERIANVQTLDQLLAKQALSDQQWELIGKCIREFHLAGVYHADLNANNILLDNASKVYLIDFDKSELRVEQQKNAAWMESNLQRLKRSLLKLQGMNQTYCFSDSNWTRLLDGYAFD